MKNMNKKDWLFIATLLIFILLFKYYRNVEPIIKPIIPNNTKEITTAKKNEQIAGNDYNAKVKKSNEVKVLVPIYKDRWRTKYDTIYKEAPATCHYYLAKLNNEKRISDSINDLVVKTYSDVITSGAVYLAKKDSVIKYQCIALKSDSLTIDSLVRSKKKYFKGFKHGFISGVIISGAVNVGSKLIKP